MAQIQGKYQLVKNENLSEYLVAVGVSEDTVKMIDGFKFILEINVDGKHVTLTTNIPGQETLSRFILNQEVDEAFLDYVLKSTAELDGDELTVTSITPHGKSRTRVYKASETELVTTVSGVDLPTAHSYFKRI